MYRRGSWMTLPGGLMLLSALLPSFEGTISKSKVAPSLKRLLNLYIESLFPVIAVDCCAKMFHANMP